MKRVRNKNIRILIWLVLVVAVINILFFGLKKLLLADYHADGTAGSAAYNYQLALIEEDYLRAYGYLSSSLPADPLHWKLSSMIWNALIRRIPVLRTPVFGWRRWKWMG